MCVIIVKRAGDKLPTKEVLKAGYVANPDGCGFATSGGYMWKGLQFDEFWAQFRQHARVEDDVMVHFRWATHGSVKQSNCHPFTDADGGVVFMHNGVLNIPSIDDKTDSEICFNEKIMPMLALNDFTVTPVVRRKINVIAGSSKFAMLINGKLYLFGHWETYGKLICSNLRFLWNMRQPCYYRRTTSELYY